MALKTILIKRGNKIDLPKLLPGELGFCEDTKELFIGSMTGNINITDTYSQAEIDNLLANLDAYNIRFNGSGTNYLTAKTEVEGAIKELDVRVKTNADTVALKVDTSDVVDNLTSTDADKPLSANQGKVLKDAVDLIDTQISNLNHNKADKIALQALASGSPKGVFPTLAALQAAYPTGDNSIYVVTADGHWYYWNGSVWADGGTYLSTLPDSKLDERSTNSVQNGVVSKTFDTIADKICGETYSYTHTGYYKDIRDLLVPNNLYLIEVSVATSGNYTIQTCIEESLSTAVAMLFNNVYFEANERRCIIAYAPASSGNENYLRLNANDVSWSIKISKLEKNYDYIKSLQDLLTEQDYNDKTPIILDTQTDGFYNIYGNFTPDIGRLYAIVSTNIEEGQVYSLNSFIKSTQIPAILFFNNNNFLSYLKLGTGQEEVLRDYLFTIPYGCNKIIVQSAIETQPISLSLVNVRAVSKSYTKEQTNLLFSNKCGLRYGLRWRIDDNDDLGERCFGAEGLNAEIGVGSVDGQSDFDNIYPWSEIKRCNIKVNSNGAYVVTYEGETGFSLDGSNGDVFVRIPKFSILRYKEDGYEYRVIGVPNAPTHEAFIENGKELDEIFISAFEGYIDDDGKLYSKSDVIPTSNITPTDFLTSAQAKGEKYSLYDNRCVDAIWTLMAVEYGTRNTNSVLGFGLGAFLQPLDNSSLKVREASESTNSVKILKMSADYKLLLPVGSNITICDGSQTNIVAQRKIVSIVDDETYTTIAFDGTPVSVNTDCFVGSAALHTNFCENTPSGALSWHTGRANWSQYYPTAQNPIRYRWIENPFGNLWHFLPDVTFVNGQMYVCKNMLDYEFFKHDGSVYQAIGNVFAGNSDNGNKANIRNANYWITSLADETFAKYVLFGRSYDKSLLAQQAFGAYYYLYDDQTVCIANGGGFDHLYRCNMLTNRAWITVGERWYLYGARLIYKNI